MTVVVYGCLNIYIIQAVKFKTQNFQNWQHGVSDTLLLPGEKVRKKALGVEKAGWVWEGKRELLMLKGKGRLEKRVA
jgi:hypothetical protein